MFGLEFLDVAIGLILVFLLISLALTALQEMLETIVKSRAKDLEGALALMLEQRDRNGSSRPFLKQFYEHNLIYGLYKGSFSEPGAPAQSKLKSYLSQTNLPSYIPRDIFSSAILDLHGKGIASPELTDTINRLKHLYGSDIDRIRGELENWYDGVMDRVSGWYKRRTQVVIFGLGLLAAAVFNINTVTIFNYLSHSQESRTLAVGLAEKVVRSGQIPSDKCNETSASDTKTNANQTIDACGYRLEMEKLGLPLGWSEASRKEAFGQFPEWNWPWVDLVGSLVFCGNALLFLVGWFLTALAASLGAPFWFDLLNKIMVIRSTVKPTEKSPNEKSEDGAVRIAPRPAAAAAPTLANAGAPGLGNDEVVG